MFHTTDDAELDILTEMILDLSEEFPAFKRVLIDERDEWLAHQLITTGALTSLRLRFCPHCMIAIACSHAYLNCMVPQHATTCFKTLPWLVPGVRPGREEWWRL